MFKIKRREVKAVIPIRYERINFLRDFKNNGYVKKVLSLSEKYSDSDVVYYNERERTEIPCIENEILIISDHDNKNYENRNSTYTLVQTDFSIPCKYKILMIKDTKECPEPTIELHNYIKKNKLVEIRKPQKKQPQIDFGYGSMLLESLERLSEINPKDILHQENKLNELILENARLSNKFIELEKQLSKKTARIRFKNRVEMNIDLIFYYSKKRELTIQKTLQYVKEYQENYYYNI